MIGEISEKNDFDVVVIRHARSIWNEDTIDIATEMKLKGYWESWIQNKQFNTRLTYNPKYFDTPLCEFGIKQCQKTKIDLKNTKIDLILVSPQIRTLQTCKGIFGQRNIPVKVEPLLMEIVRYSCDISEETSKKKQMFPEYDFSKVDDLGEDWSLEILPHNKKEIALKHYQEKGANCPEKKNKIFLQLLSKEIISEAGKDIRQRIAKLKDQLKQLKKKYPVIALVSHNYTIQCILSKGFDEDGELIDWIGIDNCLPYLQHLDTLLKIK